MHQEPLLNWFSHFRSRALAIASSKGSFALVALKDVDEIKAEIDAWNPQRPESFKPLKEVSVFMVKDSH